MLLSGVYIMITGMGVVVAFLCLLILTMHLTSSSLAIINKFIPEPIEEKGKLEKIVEQNDEIAVVLAAVKAYTS